MRRLALLAVAATAAAAAPAAQEPTLLRVDFAADGTVAGIDHNANATEANVEAFYDAEGHAVEGWYRFGVRPVLAALDHNATRAALAIGAAEGFLTAPMLWDAYNNTVDSLSMPEDLAQNISEFIDEHIDHMRAMTRSAGTDFERRVGLLMAQLEGLAAGYSLSEPAEASRLTFRDHFLNSYQTEIGDVVTKMVYENKTDAAAPEVQALLAYAARMRQHCSAMIKVTADDVFLAHDTWSGFNSMLRQYKTYGMPTLDGKALETVSMSSYPGSLSSIDDFYVTSHGLAVTETTNGCSNQSLQASIRPESVSEWARVMVANIDAQTGEQWRDLFLTQNSGTYNNQYMVLDMKLFERGVSLTAPRPGFLWIVEQLPDPYSRSADMTWFLKEKGYWPSYNIPYFKSVYVAGGSAAEEHKWGPVMNYHKYARAQIFAALHGGVATLDDMKRVMRYNEFKTDNASLIPNCTKCWPAFSPMLSVASRGDLVPCEGTDYESEPVVLNSTASPLLHQSPFGAIDTKVTSYSQMYRRTPDGKIALGAAIIDGPTHDNEDTPVFAWSKYLDGDNTCAKYKNATPATEASLRRQGQPLVFNFSFVDVTSPWAVAVPVSPAHGGSGAAKKSKVAAYVIGGVSAVVVLGVIAFVVYRARRKRVDDDEATYEPLDIAAEQPKA